MKNNAMLLIYLWTWFSQLRIIMFYEHIAEWETTRIEISSLRAYVLCNMILLMMSLECMWEIETVHVFSFLCSFLHSLLMPFPKFFVESFFQNNFFISISFNHFSIMMVKPLPIANLLLGLLIVFSVVKFKSELVQFSIQMWNYYKFLWAFRFPNY